MKSWDGPSTRAAESWFGRYHRIRQETERICAPLAAEDAQVQPMPDVSPPKWHLGHTTWFFERFVLNAIERNHRPFDSRFEFIFNSYYEGVGPRIARHRRGNASRPTLAEVLRYRREIDQRIEAGMKSDSRVAEILELGLHHEQQHQELLWMDIKNIFWSNPLRPRWEGEEFVTGPRLDSGATEFAWIEGGLVGIGSTDRAFAFDNERPIHRVFLEPYSIASRCVSETEYLEFIESGGYRNPLLWLSDGWAWLQKQAREDQPCEAPLYWEKRGGRWSVFDLQGERAPSQEFAVCHLSYFEADAFARWKGARLPTEFEWEHAAVTLGYDSPAPVWQWTSSAYQPYPGFVPAEGALAEYNGKFMCNQQVLRGGSWATPSDHIRSGYRNFYPAAARWQFSGIRLARSIR